MQRLSWDRCHAAKHLVTLNALSRVEGLMIGLMCMHRFSVVTDAPLVSWIDHEFTARVINGRWSV